MAAYSKADYARGYDSPSQFNRGYPGCLEFLVDSTVSMSSLGKLASSYELCRSDTENRLPGKVQQRSGLHQVTGCLARRVLQRRHLANSCMAPTSRGEAQCFHTTHLPRFGALGSRSTSNAG